MQAQSSTVVTATLEAAQAKTGAPGSQTTGLRAGSELNERYWSLGSALPAQIYSAPERDTGNAKPRYKSKGRSTRGS